MQGGASDLSNLPRRTSCLTSNLSEKDCEASQTDLIQPRRAGVEGEGEIARVRFVSLSPPNKRSLCRGAPR
jgi:hypothetical protein